MRIQMRFVSVCSIVVIESIWAVWWLFFLLLFFFDCSFYKTKKKQRCLRYYLLRRFCVCVSTVICQALCNSVDSPIFCILFATICRSIQILHNIISVWRLDTQALWQQNVIITTTKIILNWTLMLTSYLKWTKNLTS